MWYTSITCLFSRKNDYQSMNLGVQYPFRHDQISPTHWNTLKLKLENWSGDKGPIQVSESGLHWAVPERLSSSFWQQQEPCCTSNRILSQCVLNNCLPWNLQSSWNLRWTKLWKPKIYGRVIALHAFLGFQSPKVWVLARNALMNCKNQFSQSGPHTEIGGSHPKLK